MCDTTGPKIWARQVPGRRWAQRRRVGVAEHAGERHPSHGSGLGASIASAKRKGPVYGFSPRARGGRSSSGVASAASYSGGARTASGKRSKQRCVGLLDCPNRLRMCLWGRYGGQGGREPIRGEEILGDRLTGGGGPSRIPALQARGRGQQARGGSWARGGAPAVVGRGWEAVAWPVRGGARRGGAERREGGG